MGKILIKNGRVWDGRFGMTMCLSMAPDRRHDKRGYFSGGDIHTGKSAWKRKPVGLPERGRLR